MSTASAQKVRAVPQSVFAHAYTGLESARLGVQLMQASIDAEQPDDEDLNENPLRMADVQSVVMACESLQERVTAPRLTVPERVLKTIHAWKNRWPFNFPFAEATCLALTLARMELDKAIDILESRDDLDTNDALRRPLLGAWDVVHGKSDLIHNCIVLRRRGPEELIEDILAGRKLPSFATDAEVKDARRFWAEDKEDRSRLSYRDKLKVEAQALFVMNAQPPRGEEWIAEKVGLPCDRFFRGILSHLELHGLLVRSAAGLAAAEDVFPLI